jgi:hypothetical protein
MCVFVAPQVMDASVLYAHNAAFAGHPVMFREAPFLLNPRSPSWIRHAATSISSGVPDSCPEDGSPCAEALPGRPPAGVNQQVGLDWAGGGGRGACGPAQHILVCTCTHAVAKLQQHGRDVTMLAQGAHSDEAPSR